MQYLLKVADATGQHMVLLTMEEFIANRPASDVVFDVVGASDPNELVQANVLGAGQIDDLVAIQKIIFDHDNQGPFIRDGIEFEANRKPLDPDANMVGYFQPADRDGIKYMHCELTVNSPAMKAVSVVGLPEYASKAPVAPPGDPMQIYGQIMFLHQMAIGFQLDVTKDFAELADLLPELERKELIDIDVKKASYKLTDGGRVLYDKYIAEAQDLIKRYDIFVDTDVDSSGKARFDTGLGRDLRVAVYEFEGVDPFRARFLLGINDGEWNQLSNWYECIASKEWYANVFKPVETAAGVDDIGRELLRSIIDEGKAALRSEQYRYN